MTLVYDPDGLNPYGRELAALLRDHGVSARALTARDAEWLPPQTRNTLPANRSRPGRLRQLAALLHSLTLATASVCRGETVIIVLTRSALDELVLGLLSLFGRVVLIVHDPVPKQRPRVARRISFGLLIRTARVRVAHSSELGSLVPRGALVVRILPYVRWCADMSARSTASSGLLMLGQLRPDKGLDRLAAALAGTSRQRLIVCGKGRVEGAAVDDLLRVADMEDRSDTEFVSDAEIASALRESRVLVAPYRDVSQSATAALAATAGLAVVAYDCGSIGSVPGVTTVPDGDAMAFARAVTSAVESPQTVDVASWSRAAAADWVEILARVAGRRRHGPAHSDGT